MENNYYLKLNLQFFASSEGGEKTEEPTAKKIKDARTEGQVAKSNELVTGISLVTVFIILKIFIGTMSENFQEVFKEYFGYISLYKKENFTAGIVFGLMRNALLDIGLIGAPIFLCTIASGLMVNIMQIKWEVTTKPLMPKLDKFNPVNGFKRIISKDKIFDLIKEIIKITVILYIAYTTLRSEWQIILTFYDYSLIESIENIGNVIINLGLKISIVFVIIGIGDFIYQKFKFKKDLMMTKQEIKDEYKQTEGDPQVKSRIRGKMQEAARARMMQNLPQADVVITNPTHLAVAIKYDKEQNSAPVVIAKGADYVAAKIKEVAKEHDIVIVENKPLARMLYHNVDIGSEIPQELYQMVAEILVYVYGVKNKIPTVE